MLKRLLKYDLKNLFKYLITFYCITIILGLLTRLFLSTDTSLVAQSIGRICELITIGFFAAILINTILRSWVKFRNSFFGDEAYLTHTLPVKKSHLYASKTISSCIGVLTSALVILLTLFIEYYSKDNMISLIDSIRSITNSYDVNVPLIIISFIFLVLAQYSLTLQAGYTGILFGHKMNDKKIIMSIIIASVVYTLLQGLTLLVVFIIGLFNQNIMNMFISNEVGDFSTAKLILLIAVILYVLMFILVYLFNNFIFKKGVNVE